MGPWRWSKGWLGLSLGLRVPPHLRPGDRWAPTPQDHPPTPGPSNRNGGGPGALYYIIYDPRHPGKEHSFSSQPVVPKTKTIDQTGAPGSLLLVVCRGLTNSMEWYTASPQVLHAQTNHQISPNNPQSQNPTSSKHHKDLRCLKTGFSSEERGTPQPNG